MDTHVDPDVFDIGAIGMRGIRRSKPVVQPTVAYGRCVAGNGGVLSVLTMYSRGIPANDHREMAIWMAPAVGALVARLRGMVNVSEVLINPVTNNEPTLLVKALTKRCAIGSSAWHSDDADITMVAEKTPPNPHMLSIRNWVNPYRCLNANKSPREVRALWKLYWLRRDRQTVRNAVL